MRLILALALAFVAVNAGRAEDFVFETSMARLVIRSDGLASSLTEKQNGKEQLQPQGLPFAAARKGGHLFSASAVERRGGLFHLTFGTSGLSADYRVTASAAYIVVELAEVQGDGIEEIRLLQLSTPLAHSGGTLLDVQWDDDFAVSLMGLSEQVDSKIAGSVTSASVYPEFTMQGQRVAIIAAPTPRFLETVQEVVMRSPEFQGTTGGSEIVIDSDGRFAYAADRFDDIIVTFAISPESGRLTLLNRISCGGKVPRHIALDPSGRWLLVANQVSDNIAVLARDVRAAFVQYVGQVEKPAGGVN